MSFYQITFVCQFNKLLVGFDLLTATKTSRWIMSPHPLNHCAVVCHHASICSALVLCSLLCSLPLLWFIYSSAWCFVSNLSSLPSGLKYRQCDTPARGKSLISPLPFHMKLIFGVGLCTEKEDLRKKFKKKIKLWSHQWLPISSQLSHNFPKTFKKK